MYKYLSVIFSSLMLLNVSPVVKAADLHIDVPVELEEANVVYNAGRLTWHGDFPYQLAELSLLATAHSNGTKGEIVAVFHGDSGYILLDDDAYNIARGVTTGNPYKSALKKLMEMGVQLEECGITAAANHWGNSDLLPGVKVNTNAVVRFAQLEQKGYTYI